MNCQADYFQAHPDSPYLMNADDVETPFNEFLKILIEQGIFGLLLFLYILYCLFDLNFFEKTRMTRISSLILFILIFGLFSYPFDKLPFVALFVFSTSILSKNQNVAFTISVRKMSYLRTLLLPALCLVAWKMTENAYHYSQSCRAWNRALMCFASDEEKSLSQLKRLYPDLENNPVFLITYGKALCLGKHYPEAAAVLEKAVKKQPVSTSYIEMGKCYEAEGFPEKAFTCWKRASLMVPARFTPLYLTMKLHFKNEEYSAAQENARELLGKKIKIDNPEIDPMKREARDIVNFHPPDK